MIRRLACTAAACALFAAPAAAITLQIGDVDSFGYDASDPTLRNVNGDQVDLNDDGFIGVDEAMPDLNQNGIVSATAGDNRDNRSAAEAADPFARWTDISLSTSWTVDPGDLRDIAFVLTFDAPQPGDADFVDHFFNVLGGDIGDPGGSIVIDGASRTLTSFQGEGLIDGGVTLTSVDVPLSDMLDGELAIDFNGSDPYVWIDAMLLDTDQRAPDLPSGEVPLPATGLMLLAAAGALAVRRRRG